jgi:DNA-binding GntR family transcriptional regulator
MQESTIVRGVLEQAAVEMGVEKLKGSIAQLDAENKAVKAALDAGDATAISSHSTQFHRLLVEACDNQLLIDAWNNLNLEVKFRMCVTQAERSELESIIISNAKVIEALAVGDGKMAGKILRERAEICSKEMVAPQTPVPAGINESSRIVITR